MKETIDFNILANGLNESAIRENYKDHVVFKWLNLPCLRFCSPNGVLTQEKLFYCCFQVLDFVKQFGDASRCVIRDELECTPFKIKRFFDLSKYNGDKMQCDKEKVLLITALEILLRPITLCPWEEDGPTIYKDEFLYQALADNEQDMLLSNRDEWRNTSSYIDYCLTDGSHFYQFEVNSPNTGRSETHIVDFLPQYLISKQYISQEIENLPHKTTPENNNELNGDPEQIQQLKLQIQQQKEQIESLQTELQAYKQHPEGSVKICKGCKSKAAALFSAMFYAGYFQGEDGISGRDDIVGYILKYAFGDTRNNLRPLLSAYINFGGGSDFEALKKQLRKTIERQLDDALEDLKGIKNVTIKPNHRETH